MQDLITVSRAARELDRSESTIRKWANDGSLRVAVTLENGTRLFERSTIEDRKRLDLEVVVNHG
jgi:DNA-binding transcriptional MerR regulator